MKKYIAMFAAGLLGGLIGSVIFAASPLQAAFKDGQFGAVNIYNAVGQRVGTLANAEGEQGVLFLFSDSGKTTVQMGSYPSGGEKGQALIGMNDPMNQLRMLLRLHGDDNSPTFIMKDRYGTDKIVIGLKGDNQTPYFEYKNDDGRVVNLLGN